MTEDLAALGKFLDGRTVGLSDDGDGEWFFQWRGPGYDEGYDPLTAGEVATLLDLTRSDRWPMTDGSRWVTDEVQLAAEHAYYSAAGEGHFNKLRAALTAAAPFIRAEVLRERAKSIRRNREAGDRCLIGYRLANGEDDESECAHCIAADLADEAVAFESSPPVEQLSKAPQSSYEAAIERVRALAQSIADATAYAPDYANPGKHSTANAILRALDGES